MFSQYIHVSSDKNCMIPFVVVQLLSCVRLFASLQTVARQAPLSMGFFRQEYWNGYQFPPLGDLPDPGIEICSLSLQANSLPSELPGKPNFSIRPTKWIYPSPNPCKTHVWIHKHLIFPPVYGGKKRKLL